MAIIQSGYNNNALQDVEPLNKSARVTFRPNDSLAWNNFGVQSGAITGLAANSAIFSFRNISTNKIVIKRLNIGFVLTTAFTAAQQMQFALLVQRGFNVSDSGGTAISFAGNNAKLKTEFNQPVNVDARIATTTALTAGTKTPDTNYLAFHAIWATGIGATLLADQGKLIHDEPNSHPLILGQNEGFNIILPTAMGAGGVGTAFVNGSFAEVSSFL